MRGFLLTLAGEFEGSQSPGFTEGSQDEQEEVSQRESSEDAIESISSTVER